MDSLTALSDVPSVIRENSEFLFHEVALEDCSTKPQRFLQQILWRTEITTKHPCTASISISFSKPLFLSPRHVETFFHTLRLNVAFTKAHMLRIGKVNYLPSFLPTCGHCDVTEDADRLWRHYLRCQAAWHFLVEILGLTVSSLQISNVFSLRHHLNQKATLGLIYFLRDTKLMHEV